MRTLSLKTLVGKLKNKRKIYESISQQQEILEKKKEKLKNEIEDLERKQKKLCKNYVVSEHAILRKMERIDGTFNYDVTSKTILDDKVMQYLEDLGFPTNLDVTHLGMKIIIRDNIVVTVRKI